MAQMFFNEIEAAKIAQNMERDGIDFYTRAADKAETDPVRETFLKLVDDEKKHLKRFQELDERLQDNREQGRGYTDDPDLGAYIHRLLETQVFAEDGSVARLADQAESDIEALGTAMKAERDAIIFYEEMLKHIDSSDARDAFGAIVDEEREHLRILGDRSEDCANLTG
jgi:rubrerythrin